MDSREPSFRAVRSDNKTVYKIIPSIGPNIFVEFWDGKTTVSDKMFIRDKTSLMESLKYNMRDYVKRMEKDMGISRQQTKEILANLLLWAEQDHR